MFSAKTSLCISMKTISIHQCLLQESQGKYVKHGRHSHSMEIVQITLHQSRLRTRINLQIQLRRGKSRRRSQKLDKMAFNHQTSSKRREALNSTPHPVAATKLIWLIPNRTRKSKLHHSSGIQQLRCSLSRSSNKILSKYLRRSMQYQMQ